MHSNEKLDEVLTYLNREYDTHMKSNGFPKDVLIFKSKSEMIIGMPFKGKSSITHEELANYEPNHALDLILEYLEEERLVVKDASGKIPKYCILWKGKVLIENGGYGAIYEKEQRQKRSQNLKDSLLIVGTWLAGVTGSFLVVNELLKNFGWIGTINFWVLFFLLLSGMVMGIIAAQLLRPKDK